MMQKTSLAAAALLAVAMALPAMAQTTTMPTPAVQPSTSVPTNVPMGKTINKFYKQSVYDPGKTVIGKIDDIVISDSGQITAFIVGVGGFLGMGEKDVAVPFDAVHPLMKDNEWYLTMNTTKDQLKAAPALTFDKTKTSWVAE